MKNYLRIRLARWGAKNNPFYGIVVANKSSPRDGKHVERVGTYNPTPQMVPEEYREYLLQKGPGNPRVQMPERKVKHIELNVERIKFWLASGAHPSSKVAWILAKVSLIVLL